VRGRAWKNSKQRAHDEININSLCRGVFGDSTEKNICIIQSMALAGID